MENRKTDDALPKRGLRWRKALQTPIVSCPADRGAAVPPCVGWSAPGTSVRCAGTAVLARRARPALVRCLTD